MSVQLHYMSCFDPFVAHHQVYAAFLTFTFFSGPPYSGQSLEDRAVYFQFLCFMKWIFLYKVN